GDLRHRGRAGRGHAAGHGSQLAGDELGRDARNPARSRHLARRVEVGFFVFAGCRVHRDMMIHVGSKAAVLLLGVAVVGVFGCRRKGEEDIEQIGNATAMNSPALPMWRTPDELRGPMWRRAMDAVLPSAYAASCFDGSVMF